LRLPPMKSRRPKESVEVKLALAVIVAGVAAYMPVDGIVRTPCVLTSDVLDACETPYVLQPGSAAEL
jgi:hypothetical protein